MTALSMAPRLRLRPLTLLGVSLAVIVGSQVLGALTRPATLPRPQSQVAPTVSTGPVESVDGPSSETADDLATIDHSINAWTANLGSNDMVLFSATNLGLLYDGRARLSGVLSD
jgi:hypothetical protein